MGGTYTILGLESIYEDQGTIFGPILEGSDMHINDMLKNKNRKNNKAENPHK